MGTTKTAIRECARCRQSFNTQRQTLCPMRSAIPGPAAFCAEYVSRESMSNDLSHTSLNTSNDPPQPANRGLGGLTMAPDTAATGPGNAVVGHQARHEAQPNAVDLLTKDEQYEQASRRG